MRQQVLAQKPYRDLDYVLALDDGARVGTLAAVPRFGLKVSEAKQILRVIITVISGWRKTGRQLRLKASTLDSYATAFEHSLMEEARRLI